MNGCFHRGEIYHILPEDNETGSEQYSGRPAIIVSNEANNKFAPTLEVVYLTTKPKKALPTHVSIEAAMHQNEGIGANRLMKACNEMEEFEAKYATAIRYGGREAATDAMRKDLTGLCDLDIRLPVLKAPRNRREEQLRMARDQGGKIAWLVMAATCRTTFKFGKDRLTRLLNESLANYRQFLEWDAEDHEYAVNKLCRIVEQALQEELKVADESKRTEFLSVSGITPHDYGEIMTAVHLARKDSSVPIAVLSQSEIDRRMGKLKRA